MNPREYYHLKTAQITEADRWQVIGDLDSRIKELRERREALLTAKIPSTLELNRAEARVMQTGLF